MENNSTNQNFIFNKEVKKELFWTYNQDTHKFENTFLALKNRVLSFYNQVINDLSD